MVMTTPLKRVSEYLGRAWIRGNAELFRPSRKQRYLAIDQFVDQPIAYAEEVTLFRTVTPDPFTTS